MEVVAMLFTYPTNCHMLRFNSNRPLSGPPLIDEEIFLTSIVAEFLENVKINHGSRSYVVYLPTNCHILRFDTNRPLYGLPTSILAVFLVNAKINRGSRSYVVYLSNELSHAKIQFKSATFWASLN
jgi:hypothetical protein